MTLFSTDKLTTRGSDSQMGRREEANGFLKQQFFFFFFLFLFLGFVLAAEVLA